MVDQGIPSTHHNLKECDMNRPPEPKTAITAKHNDVQAMPASAVMLQRLCERINRRGRVRFPIANPR